MKSGEKNLRPYVCGMDCGGSKNHCVIASADGHIVGQACGLGAANVFDSSQVRALLMAVSGEALQSAGILADAVGAVQVTLGGLNDEIIFSVTMELFSNASVKVCRESSGAAVFAGACWWGFDLALMAGTGVVAVGLGGGGRRAAAGGWGPLLHDLGSGYSVGQQALRCLADRIDERGEFTAILPGLAAYSPFQRTLSELPFLELAPVQMSYAQRQVVKNALKGVIPFLDRRAVAGIYPLVARCAASGDVLALALMQEAAESLARTTAALAADLELVAPRIIPLGGVFKATAVMLEVYTAAVRRRLPAAAVQPSDFSQIMGTLLLAWEQAGVTVNAGHIAAIRGLNLVDSPQGVK